MTTPGPSTDPIMDRITAAVGAHRVDGDPRHRDTLVDLWAEITSGGDPFHRCVLAHYLADMVDDPAQALMWDVRALDAADVLDDSRAQEHHVSLQVGAFYPSLHLNIADNLRRLGSFDAAADHLDAARARAGALSDLGPEQSGYAEMMTTLIDDIGVMIRDRSSEARSTHPA
ncbi:hypothetical protein ASG12_18305 [Williamsia sp. Leaf354]|jgi:hypothetical protein|uniref:hypothetical protein n=1 Tax=Williamsia sp. Leaf354 TaxID=1736349 RepID=UPI0006FC4CC2|nr:hypothetical protein [Williamsia sp. Leaf354]KQR96162.1 hypothetical protein ASG12_18305 [Williamsia sp. Leaf354]